MVTITLTQLENTQQKSTKHQLSPTSTSKVQTLINGTKQTFTMNTVLTEKVFLCQILCTENYKHRHTMK